MYKNLKQLNKGKLEESTETSIENGSEDAKSYLIEEDKKDANGVPGPTCEGRVVSQDSFAKAADDKLEIKPDGSVEYKEGLTNIEAKQATGLEAVLEGQCFVGTTPIYIELNNSPIDKPYETTIELIEVGDKVLSRCEITGEMAYKRVTKVFEHICTRLAIISCHYSSWDFDFNPKIKTTEEHPFWVIGKGWIAVRDLRPGDECLTYDGKKTIVESVFIDTDYEGFVYNLEVEDFHTYFADSAGILVHNTKKVQVDVKQLHESEEIVPTPEPSPIYKSEVDLAQDGTVLKNSPHRMRCTK